MNPRLAVRQIRSEIEKHHLYRSYSLNMSPSENVTSPGLRELVASDFMHRYGIYQSDRKREGNEHVYRVEEIVTELAKKVFKVDYVDIKPISGHIAMLSAISTFTVAGSAVFEISGENGGHGFYNLPINVPIVNYHPEFFPFDSEEWNIDVDSAARRIRQKRPSVIVFGSSYYLFPHPIRELIPVAQEVGARVFCDEAHVLALIAGGEWPNPLSQGAEVMTGSTHKTFPGPQKGIVMTNNALYAKRIAKTISPCLQSNHHLMNVAALGYGLAEMMQYGRAYSRQIIRNARTFGAALAEEGFDVIGAHKGFTRSHQILVRTDQYVRAPRVSQLLARSGIFASRMELQNANGLRTGTNELTRIGMKETDMQEIARFYREVIIDKKNPRTVARKVKSLVSHFRELQFSFDKGKNPYRPPELRT